MILVGCNAPQLSLHRGSFLQPGLSLRAGVGKLVNLKKDVRGERPPRPTRQTLLALHKVLQITDTRLQSTRGFFH